MEGQQFERGQGRLSAPPSRRRRSYDSMEAAQGPIPPRARVPQVERRTTAPKYQIAPVGAQNPASPSAPQKSPARRTRRRPRSGWVYAFFAIFVAYVGAVIAGGLIFGLSARSAYANVEIARERAEALDFDASRAAVTAARKDLVVASQGLFVLNLLKPIPYVGNQIRAVESVTKIGQDGLDVVSYALNIGDDILKAADDLRSIIEEQENFSFYDLPPETRASILNAIAISSSDLQTMRVRIDLAMDELDKIKTYNVAPQILAAINPLEELLPSMQQSIEFLIPVTSIIREVAGVGGDKQWLILFLNNNELRPGGGFIGVYGKMLTRDGELISLDVEDVLRADGLVQDNPKYQVKPPQPVQDYMGVNAWYFRDSNWSPDFKTSADTAMQLLRQQNGFAGQPVPEFAGVIGFTPNIAERLLKYLGPIKLDGFTFTSENVRQLLQEETQFAFLERGLSVDQRKDLIGKLTDEVVDRLIALPISEIPNVIDIFMTSFEDKQMAIRALAPDAQAAIESAGWGGVVAAPRQGDSLMVVDANMAALKTDQYVDRAITYTITPQAGRLRARVEITYIHKGEFTQLVSRYRTFTRVFVPEGSELIRVEGSLRDDKLKNPNEEPGYVLTERELGLQSFGTFTAVEPGRTKTLIFEYYLPDSIAKDLKQNRYTLNTFKQMGANNYPLTLVLDFDKNVRTAEPAEARKDRGNDRFEWTGELGEDQVFEVRF